MHHYWGKAGPGNAFPLCNTGRKSSVISFGTFHWKSLGEGIWKVSPLPYSRKPEHEEKRNLCFAWGNNERFWIWQKTKKSTKKPNNSEQRCFFFFAPSKSSLTEFMLKLVNEVPALITEWLLVQAGVTHNSLSSSHLPWGRKIVIFQTLSAFHIIFLSGITEKFTLFSLWPSCAISNILLNY